MRLWSVVCVLVLFGVAAAVGVDKYSVVDPYDEEEDSPICLPRPPVPTNPRAVPQLIKGITAFVSTSLAPCTAKPNGTSSATAISGGIVLGGVSSYFNLGCVDKQRPDVAPTEDTIYRLASVSKTFAAELVIRAYKEGLITSLDDEIRKYASDFTVVNRFGGTEQPTFRQVLAHVGGLPRQGPCLAPCPENTTVMLQRIAAYSWLIAKPNTMPSYSNLGFALLGNIVAERLYKDSYYNVLQSQVLDKLLMSNTGGIFTPSVIARMAKPYKYDGSEAGLEEMGWHNPSGGMFSTSRDISTWLRYLLVDYTVSAKRREAMQTVFQNPDSTGWSTPWEVFKSVGYTVRAKDGAIDGVRTVVALVPELNFGFWILWNGQGMDPDAYTRQIADFAIPAIVDAYISAEMEEWPVVDPQFVDTYVGNYTFAGMQLSVVMSMLEGKAVAKMIFAPGFINHYLRPSPSDPLIFQLWARRDASPCMQSQFEASIGEWVSFGTTQQGEKHVMCPGLAFAIFTKT